MEQLTPIALPLLTILASGVTSAVVTYKLNKGKEHEFYMRKKAEELFLALERYDKILSSNLIGYFPLFEGRIDYNQFLDIHNKHLDGKEVQNHDHILMITKLYFPRVEPYLHAYEEARDAANRLASQHKAAYKVGKAGDVDWVKPFKALLMQLDGKAAEFKAAIVSEGRRYSNAEPAWKRIFNYRR